MGNNESRASLLDLPDNRIAEILGYLDPDERQLLRATCTKFRDLTNQIHGIWLPITNEVTDDVLQSAGPWARELEIYNLIIPFDPTRVTSMTQIRNLNFVGDILWENVELFLRSGRDTITHLSFVDAKVFHGGRQSPQAQDQESIVMGKLDNLNLSSSKYAEGVSPVLNFLNGRVRCEAVTTITVGVADLPLTLLSQLLLIQRRNEGEAAEPLHTFLTNHGSVVLTELDMWATEYTEGYIFQANDPKIPVKLEFSVPPLQQVEDQLQLKRLEVNSWSNLVEDIGDMSPQLRIDHPASTISHFLEGQKSLKVLKLIDCDADWSLVRSVITENAGTLEEFRLWDSTVEEDWDCAIFRQCVALKTANIAVSECTRNLSLFPPSLKELRVFGRVNYSDIVGNEHLQELESLILSMNLGDQQLNVDELITVKVFETMTQLPKIKALRFIASDDGLTCRDWVNIMLWCHNLEGTPGFKYFTEAVFSDIHIEVSHPNDFLERDPIP